MPPLAEPFIPSNPNNFKSKHVRNRKTFRRSFSTTVFLWTLVLIALTTLYLSFLESYHDRIDEIQWEKDVRSSAQIRRVNGISVLVTGAAGFIGTHVSLALKTRGDGVVGVDNFDNYYSPSLKMSRWSLLDAHGVFIVDGDINDRRLLASLFDTVAFTHVMHLAAQVGIRYAVENPYTYVSSNIAGFVTLLEQCKSSNPQPAIVWASSGSVYGSNHKPTLSESDRPDQPSSLYASTKKTGEEITRTYNRVHGLSITGLRFFTVYGPWGRPDMAYISFIRDILHGRPITVYRGKNHIDLPRDFTYIDDIVKGCVASLDTSGKGTGSNGSTNGSAPYRIFNLGSKSPVTVSALVTILEENLEMKANIEMVDTSENHNDLFAQVNISLAQRELGYKPTTDLQTGLRKLVKWYLWYYGKPIVPKIYNARFDM